MCNKVFCSKLFMRLCKWEKKKGDKIGIFCHSGIQGSGGTQNLGPSNWQPGVLATTPFHIYNSSAILHKNALQPKIRYTLIFSKVKHPVNLTNTLFQSFLLLYLLYFLQCCCSRKMSCFVLSFSFVYALLLLFLLCTFLFITIHNTICITKFIECHPRITSQL